MAGMVENGVGCGALWFDDFINRLVVITRIFIDISLHYG